MDMKSTKVQPLSAEHCFNAVIKFHNLTHPLQQLLSLANILDFLTAGCYGDKGHQRCTGNQLTQAVTYNHPPMVKFGVIRTLKHRARTIWNNSESLNHETRHLIETFKPNGYPEAKIKHALTTKKNILQDDEILVVTSILE